MATFRAFLILTFFVMLVCGLVALVIQWKFGVWLISISLLPLIFGIFIKENSLGKYNYKIPNN